MFRLTTWCLIAALSLPSMTGAHPAPQPKPDTCQVHTMDIKGKLATVQTGDGQPLNFAEAVQIIKVLNDRHNNGTNPVLAVLDCS